MRRGQKNQGSGLPQLASGELGWAIDTRELYIGNGSVSEGAPAVGNTQILTENSDIFNLADQYGYRANDSFIQTGATSTTPIQRTLQDRLDDIVSVKAFGATGESSQTATVLIQRAIDQLFLNSATKGSVSSRVVLYFEPGEYVIDDTLYIPPNATLVGAGIDKTIIRQTADAAIVQTVNESSTPGSPANDSTSTTDNQAQNIRIENLTFETTQSNKGVVLQSCKDSLFRNIKIKGAWGLSDSITTTNVALEMNSLSGIVSTDNNTLENCEFTGFSYAVISNWDISKNSWHGCMFDTLGFGLVFGENIAAPGSAGQTNGAMNNTVNHSIFTDIERNGIWIEVGYFNESVNNKFIDVGNDGGTEGNATYSVIKYTTEGNDSTNDYFSRTASLSYDQNFIFGTAYIPEIEGKVNGVMAGEHEVSISSTGATPIKLFRLPGDQSKSIQIDYTLKSNNYDVVRNGTMFVTVDLTSDQIQLSDEFEYVGNSLYLDDIEFSAQLIDEDGDTNVDTVGIYVLNSIASDDSVIKFKLKPKH